LETALGKTAKGPVSPLNLSPLSQKLKFWENPCYKEAARKLGFPNNFTRLYQTGTVFEEGKKRQALNGTTIIPPISSTDDRFGISKNYHL
jgi:hypothetical protein